MGVERWEVNRFRSGSGSAKNISDPANRILQIRIRNIGNFLIVQIPLI